MFDYNVLATVLGATVLGKFYNKCSINILKAMKLFICDQKQHYFTCTTEASKCMYYVSNL